MDIRKISLVKRLAAAFAGFVLITFSLSTYYYRSPEINPVSVWHGANMSVRSLFSGAGESGLPIDSELMARVSDGIDEGRYRYPEPIASNTVVNTITDFELKNQIAANEERNEHLKKHVNRLDEVNQQLLNSKSTLEALNQNYSAVSVYGEAEADRRVKIQAALESELKLASEEDAQALVSAKTRSRQSTQSIPEAVLNNVQKTTGISADEINELMNQ